MPKSIKILTSNIYITCIWQRLCFFIIISCHSWQFQRFQRFVVGSMPFKYNIVIAFWGMHVSTAKHSYAWLPRKCDYRTDTLMDGQTDAGQSDPYVPLCFGGDTKNQNSSPYLSLQPLTEYVVCNLCWWVYLIILENSVIRLERKCFSFL